ncbi:MAG: replicative DNA helicase [Chitinophagales bacterium]|nr:replicative DNA helicase [Chitinophagales bacterium]MDW8418984.1 replicative DNA helicase [Chitinophagales bacterium]
MTDPTNIIKKIPRKPTLSDSPLGEIGKLPPQARELEEAVLGAVMIEENAITSVIEIIKSDDVFYVDAHQRIWRAIRNLYSNRAPIDLLTVTEQLKKNGDLDHVGGPFYVAQLTNKVGSAANAEYHAHILAEKYVQRQLISVSTEIIRDAYEDTTDVFELLDKAERNLYNISENNIKRQSLDISTILMNELKELDIRMKNSQNHLNGVPSGFIELDKITGGWQKSDLIILAARPGMGKTAFTLALARNAAVDHKKPVALFSLEMSNAQLVQRLISMETHIRADKIRRGTLENYEYDVLTSKIDSLKNAPVFIDDTPAINIFELRNKCRRLKQQYDIELVIIDYLQLMSGHSDNKSGNREQEISQISRSLKGMAKELNTPVIALSQLSRAVETRGGDKRPILSDLRESGAIEQDADIVIFLYRPEYYKIDTDEEGRPTQGIAEVIVAKHRNGPLGTIRVRYESDYAKFENLHELASRDEYFEMLEGNNRIRYKRFQSKINEDTNEDDSTGFERKHPPDDFVPPPNEPPFDKY